MTMKMTPEMRDEIRRCCDLATSEPWEWESDKDNIDNCLLMSRGMGGEEDLVVLKPSIEMDYGEGQGVLKVFISTGCKNFDDVHFIAKARTYLPRCLAEITRLQERIDELGNMMRI